MRLSLWFSVVYNIDPSLVLSFIPTSPPLSPNTCSRVLIAFLRKLLAASATWGGRPLMATVRRTDSGTEYVCVTVYNVVLLLASELAFPTLGCALAVWAGAEAQAMRRAAMQQNLVRGLQSTLLLLQDAIEGHRQTFMGHLRVAAGALESDCTRLVLGDFGTAGQQDEVMRDVRSHDPVIMKDGFLSLINLNPVRSFSSHSTHIHTSVPACLPASVHIYFPHFSHHLP